MSQVMADALAAKRTRLEVEEASVAKIVAEKRADLHEAEGALKEVQNRIADVAADLAKEVGAGC